MAIVDGLGLDLRTQTAIPAAVYFFVIGFIQRELAQKQVRQHTGMTAEQWRASVAPYIEQLLATGQYPNLQRAITSGGEEDPDAVFEFMLNLLLDAIATRLPKQRR